jgi:polyribonucleotide nucleotidyltransferase
MIHEVKRTIGGRPLSIQSGHVGRQAAGAAVVRYADSVVFGAVATAGAREGIDFFPLTVDYREVTASAGKIPGGFFKREGRPTTKETLTMRMIDRPIRPMFPEGYRDEVQIQLQVWAADPENDPDFCAMVAAFAALHLSPVPFLGPMGAVRMGYRDGEFLVNPTTSQSREKSSRLDLVLAGTPEAITMVEAGAKEFEEDLLVEALERGQAVAKEIALACEELREKVGGEKIAVVPPVHDKALEREVVSAFRRPLAEALRTKGKLARSQATAAVEEECLARFVSADLAPPEAEKRRRSVEAALEDLVASIERESILEGRRLDGRGPKDIRPISIEVGFLPRVHGSALFTRGETQAMVTTTLGTVDDEQRIDGLGEETTKKFLLHYNFPPFSVGEVRPIRGPSRREIGHGALAERAIEPMLPPHEEFPYTIRLVSTILESNGSSSMATVCGGTLALLDGGIPLQRPVAGIAMGLVKEDGEGGSRFAILSDIQGSEDHNGDMDFKVAGTERGITSLQMDIKTKGIDRGLMRAALEQAREGRLRILEAMREAMPAARPEISPFAPRIQQIRIKPDKIGALIGPGGRTVKALQEELHCKIEVVDDSGLVVVSAHGLERLEAAIERVRSLTEEAEVGRVYTGVVKSVKDFGAFVEILPGQEGLLHVSELEHGRVERVTDVVRPGDRVEVKVVDVDPGSGRIRLSRRALLPVPEGMEARPVGAWTPRGGDRDARGGGGRRGSGPPRRGGGPPRDRRR